MRHEMEDVARLRKRSEEAFPARSPKPFLCVSVGHFRTEMPSVTAEAFGIARLASRTAQSSFAKKGTDFSVPFLVVRKMSRG